MSDSESDHNEVATKSDEEPEAKVWYINKKYF